ncbi:MAG: hypothetical protein AVDCRST_MAG52-1364, partial [uncultured Blastococcus sp.]
GRRRRRRSEPARALGAVDRSAVAARDARRDRRAGGPGDRGGRRCRAHHAGRRQGPTGGGRHRGGAHARGPAAPARRRTGNPGAADPGRPDLRFPRWRPTLAEVRPAGRPPGCAQRAVAAAGPGRRGVGPADPGRLHDSLRPRQGRVLRRGVARGHPFRAPGGHLHAQRAGAGQCRAPGRAAAGGPDQPEVDRSGDRDPDGPHRRRCPARLRATAGDQPDPARQGGRGGRDPGGGGGPARPRSTGGRQPRRSRRGRRGV